jgi:hypothetical protein
MEGTKTWVVALDAPPAEAPADSFVGIDTEVTQ